MGKEQNNNYNPITFAQGNAVNGIIITGENNSETGAIICSGNFTVTGTIGASRNPISFMSLGDNDSAPIVPSSFVKNDGNLIPESYKTGVHNTTNIIGDIINPEE